MNSRLPQEPSRRPESIRDLQRRRRDAERVRADVEAILAAPGEADDEDEDEDYAGPTPLAPAAKVFVVFRGAQWSDPDGALRESDSIVGVFGSEEAARRAVAEMNNAVRQGAAEQDDAWYQPYPMQP